MHRRALPFHLSTVVDGDNDGGDGKDGDVTTGADGEQTVSVKTMQERVGRATAAARREQKAEIARLQAESDELARLKNADKTVQERLAEELAAMKAKSAEQDAENMQLRLAVDNGIGSEDRGLIGVGDEATVTARAKRVGELLAAEKKLVELEAAHAESLKQGGGIVGRPVQPKAWVRPGATAGDTGGGQSAKALGEAQAAKFWGPKDGKG